MKPALPDFPPLPDNPRLGQSYQRPCVRAAWLGKKPEWFPILGNVHSDPEFIKADFQHAHVDYRFLSQRIRQRIEEQITRSHKILRLNTVYSTPVSFVWPSGSEEPIRLEDIHGLNIDPTSWLTVRARKYQGPYPPYPHHVTHWAHHLSEAYAGRTLINGRVCPHQGTDLSGITPDEMGIITCPLHGLRWEAKTGRIVMPDGTVK